MKRINVKLVAGLAIGLVVFLALTIGLHEYQSNRRADGLLVRAEDLKEKGEYSDAVRLISNYLRRRPEHKEAYSNFALTLQKLIGKSTEEGKPMDPNVLRLAFTALEQALRENPDDLEVRNAAIEFDMRMRRFSDAIVHLNYLKDLPDYRDDPEVRVKLATCYYQSGQENEAKSLLQQLIGFDEATRSFRPDQALAPTEMNAYGLLATIFEKNQRRDLASSVINQAIRANPEDHKAYLMRASFLRSRNDTETAIRDVARAVELAPEDPIVLQTAGAMALETRDFDRTKLMFDRLVKVAPEKVDGYMGLSRWAAAQDDLEQSMKYLESAIELAPLNLEVLWQQTNMQLEMNKPDEAEETVRKIQSVGGQPWFVNFLEGRIALHRKKWLLASEKLEAARPMVSQIQGSWTKSLDLNLARCYDRLGKQDMRLSVLSRVLQADPGNLAARLRKAQAHASLGQADRAINDYNFLRTREMDPNTTDPKTLLAFLQLEILKQRQLDKENRNWKAAENLVRAIGQNPSVPRAEYADVMAMYYKASDQKEREAKVRAKMRAENPDSLRYVLEEILTRGNTPEGFESAVRDLRELRKTKGDTFQFRIMEAQLTAAMRPEDTQQRLAALEEGIDEYTDNQKAELWYQLGRLHAATKNFDDAKRLWGKYGEIKPNDANHIIRVFELAMISEDDDAATAALKRFETILPKGKESAEWKWAKAALITRDVRAQKLPNAKLAEARALINEAISQRELWEPLYRLNGEIQLMSEKVDAAIESYEKALSLGSKNAEAYRRLVRLYYEKRDYRRTKDMLDQLPRSQWEPLEQRINVDVLARLGELPDDLDYNAESTEPNDHLSVGSIYAQAGRNEEAEVAFRRAIELDPSRASTWGSLFELLLKTNRESEARELLKTAATKIDEKNAPMLFGASYHMLEEWEKAEAQYAKALSSDPDNLEVLTAMSKVYLASRQREKAREVLMKMVTSEEPHLQQPKRSVAWARRAMAELVSQNSTYEDFKKALSLIEDNAPEGAFLRPEDLLTYAQISARRPEAITHRETIKKLERARDERRLSDNELLVLAELYKRQGRWSDCKSVMMLDLLTRHAEDARYIVPWLSWLIDEKDYDSARIWVKKIPGDSLPAVRTKAHIAADAGNVTQAIKIVLGMVPKDRKRTLGDVPQLAALAGILEELGEFDPKGLEYSEKVWREVVKLEPQRTLQLGSYYNRRDDAESAKLAIAACEKSFKLGNQLPALQMSLYVMRKQYGRLMNDPSNEKLIRQLFGQAMKDNPDSGTALVLRSEFEDLVGNSEESLKFLQQFLSKQGTHPREKALVQNNLSYKLAWKDRASEAASHVEEAERVLGPRSDLMDTKGVVQIFGGQVDAGIETIMSSINDGGPSPLKYFHLAYGYWKKGDKQAAVAAIRDAEQMEIDPSTMIGEERRAYEDLLREMRSEGLVKNQSQ